MTSGQSTESPVLPPPPGPVFLVGIGGIGMSGLAQFLRWQGYAVGGSDREISGAGRDDLYAKLRAQGIDVWPQDGAGIRACKPALVIYSTAVEKGNPDLEAAASLPCLHRAQALAAALNRVPAKQLAVAGSCGKTSVTAWLASALRALGVPVVTVCGGYIREFVTERLPGNFFADSAPEWLVYEVDESDGSLVSFSPDVGVVLNIGTDHYDRPKLLELFSACLSRCRAAGVILDELGRELALPEHLAIQRFAPCPATDAGAAETRGNVITPADYSASPEGICFRLHPLPCPFFARQYGRHSATNAAAVAAALRTASIPCAATTWPRAFAAFRGVARRFDYIGATSRGIAVFDDYAHNVEKIRAAIATAQELTAGRVAIIFQPHGFGPLTFMRDPLREALAAQLRPGDSFALLPVYYAGGSTSFQPTSEEVAADYRQAALNANAFPGRAAAAAFVRDGAAGAATVLVLGARDPSLPHWCRELAGL